MIGSSVLAERRSSATSAVPPLSGFIPVSTGRERPLGTDSLGNWVRREGMLDPALLCPFQSPDFPVLSGSLRVVF